jgi:hypothetical protein
VGQWDTDTGTPVRDSVRDRVGQWDRSAEKPLFRKHTITGERIELERGVNFFVLALEAAGAQVQYTCEGHPEGFGITFRASYALASRIASAGFFGVRLLRDGRWRIELNEAGYTLQTGLAWTISARNEVLRYAADAWTEAGLEAREIVEAVNHLLRDAPVMVPPANEKSSSPTSDMPQTNSFPVCARQAGHRP